MTILKSLPIVLAIGLLALVFWAGWIAGEFYRHQQQSERWLEDYKQSEIKKARDRKATEK